MTITVHLDESETAGFVRGQALTIAPKSALEPGQVELLRKALTEIAGLVLDLHDPRRSCISSMETLQVIHRYATEALKATA